MFGKGFIASNIIFSFILLIFLIIFSSVIYQHYFDNKITQEWSRQNAVVVDSSVVESKCGKASNSVCHCLQINVNFSYFGQKFNSNLETQDNCLDAEYQIKKFPKNKSIVVFVNEENHREIRSLDFPLRSPPYAVIAADIFILFFIFFLLKSAIN